jgi:hypothetical protein
MPQIMDNRRSVAPAKCLNLWSRHTLLTIAILILVREAVV